MRSTLSALFAIILSIAAQHANAQVSDRITYVREHFDETADPAEDLETAKALAKAEDKKILLDVGGDWCVWCEILDTYLQHDEASEAAFACSFVVLKVNVSLQNQNADFLSDYPSVPGYPHFFVLDEDGNFIKSQDTGELEDGRSYSSSAMTGFANQYCQAYAIS